MNRFDTTPDPYLTPVWDILEEKESITLQELLEQTKLDKKIMLKKIEQIAMHFKTTSMNMYKELLNKENIEKNASQKLKLEFATSNTFRYVCLYDKIKELHWSNDIMFPQIYKEMKKMYTETKNNNDTDMDVI